MLQQKESEGQTLKQQHDRMRQKLSQTQEKLRIAEDSRAHAVQVDKKVELINKKYYAALLQVELQ